MRHVLKHHMLGGGEFAQTIPDGRRGGGKTKNAASLSYNIITLYCSTGISYWDMHGKSQNSVFIITTVRGRDK